jgi:archaellum biogenesis ATPase FlaH
MAKLSDLLKGVPQREWLVKGLIPKGHVVLLAGDPGAGKSWFAESLALSVASGKPFLGVFPVLRSSVILIDEDTPEIDFNDHIKRLGIGLGIYEEDIEFHHRNKQGYQLDNDLSLNNLKALIDMVPAPVLIIFDCLGKVMGKFDDRQEKDIDKLSNQLNKIKSSDTTILELHHFGKAEGEIRKDFIKKVLGSVKLVANSDTAFGMENVSEKGETRFVLHSIERRAKLYASPTLGIELSDTQDWAKLIAMDEIPRLPTENEKIIYSYIYKNRLRLAIDEFTVSKIHGRLDKLLTEQEVRKALKKLEKQEAVVRGTKAHNLHIYQINPLTDPDNDWSLTSEYIDSLTEGL